MKLEKIVLDGFKSFADRTEFTFQSPITAIVGPNGCGKSNIVDAVKWVLGEQSAKSLRSEQMADVIFNGSSSRKPLGSAEVTLYICNRDETGARVLPIDAEQVQISRRIYRNGESEYRINNQPCRLKDIRELFMDTGIGTKAYCILEQGQIEQFLAASKIDRRFIFEEAAGISKYKAHKKEALRRLERTEQNLLRVADILNEVTKRLRSVKLQANKARTYLQYTNRLKELKVNYYLAEFDKVNQAKVSTKQQIEQAEHQLAVISAELSKKESFINKLGQKIIEKQNELNHTRNSIIGLVSKIGQQLQRIEFLQTRVAELGQRKKEAAEKLETLRSQQSNLQAELTHSIDEHQKCERMLQEKSQAARQIQQTIHQINTKSAQLSRQLEDEKSSIIDIVRKIAALNNEIATITAYLDKLSSQKNHLNCLLENRKAELEKLLTQKVQYQARASDIEKTVNQLKAQLESNRKEAEEIENQIRQDNERLASQQAARSVLESHLNIFAEIKQDEKELQNEIKNTSQSWLQTRQNTGEQKKTNLTPSDKPQETSKPDYVEAKLSDIIATEAKYTNAIEAALEELAESLVINNTNKLLSDGFAEKLQDRASFILMDRIPPFTDKKDLSKFPSVLGRAAEFVKCKTVSNKQEATDTKKPNDAQYAPLIWKLLGKTIIVDHIETALKLADRLNNEYKFVTLKGEVIKANGLLKAGPLQRQKAEQPNNKTDKPWQADLTNKQAPQLQQTINNINREIAKLEKRIKENSQKQQLLSKSYEELQTIIRQADSEKSQIAARLSAVEQNIERSKSERERITSEINWLDAQIDEITKKEINCKDRLADLLAAEETKTAQVKQLTAKSEEQKATQTQLEEKLSELKIQLACLRQHQQACAKSIENLKGQIQANKIALEKQEQEIKNSQLEIQNCCKDILNCEAMVSSFYGKKEDLNAQCSKLERLISKIESRKKEVENQKLEISQKENLYTQNLHQLKINLSQLEVKSEWLIERVAEELSIDLRKVYYEKIKNQQSKIEIDWDKIKEEIQLLRDKIDRLGNVNMDAIEQAEELEKRYNFLSSQVEDLKKSKANLEQLISRLNKKSTEQFKATFEEIRIHFQQIFRKLFGGGKADIILEEGDILEAPIEIIARPPGKQTMTISLLSGGEKSLAGIALLFAVFATKPAGFCFLDEIDAALDEANNERFNLLIREFAKDIQNSRFGQIQFIIITHTKRTMSMADELIGITMQTQGVSKKISVKFDQFDKVEEETTAVA